MEEQLQEDWLETRLREEVPYIDDAGFTAHLVAQLPARTSHRSFRGLILLCLTVLACALVYTLSGGGAFLVSAINDLTKMPLWLVGAIAILCTAIISAAAGSAAFVRVRDEILQ